MTAREFLRRFPNASKTAIAANCGSEVDIEANSAGTTPELERDSSDGSMGQSERKEAHPERVRVRFISVRKRLLDPDNLCEKYHLDCLRNSGAIAGDEPKKIILETTQRKTIKGEKEHTVIEIYDV